MHRRGRLLVAGTATVALLAGGAVAAPAVARQLIHPRDPAAFQAHLERHVDGWGDSRDPDGPARDKAWVEAHPQEVLTAGDAACAWLARQEDAPRWDPSGATSYAARHDAMLLESTWTDQLALSERGTSTVVGSAWTHLCWWDRRDKLAPVTDPDAPHD